MQMEISKLGNQGIKMTDKKEIIEKYMVGFSIYGLFPNVRTIICENKGDIVTWIDKDEIHGISFKARSNAKSHVEGYFHAYIFDSKTEAQKIHNILTDYKFALKDRL